MTTITANTSFAVVTGASSGIGLELARQFAEHDFDLLICAEDAGIASAAAELGSTGALIQPLQVTSPRTRGSRPCTPRSPRPGAR